MKTKLLFCMALFVSAPLLATIALAAPRAESPAPVQRFAAYAGPSVWGPWQSVASHLGRVTYTISASPVGDTVLRCRVRYFNAAGQQVISEWRDEVTITTGNAVANVEVSFMGLPTGSAVEGTISP